MVKLCASGDSMEQRVHGGARKLNSTGRAGFLSTSELPYLP